MKRVIAGIDWGHEENQVLVVEEDGTPLHEGRYGATGEGLQQLCEVVLAMVDEPSELHVVLEDPSRPVCHAFLAKGARVFVITPNQLSHFRGLKKTAPVKSDVFDAFLVADALRTHPDACRELKRTGPEVLMLRHLSRERESIQKDRIALSHSLTDLLRQYYPQLLALPWSLSDRVIVDLLEAETNPGGWSRRRLEEVKKLLGRCRKMSAEEVLEVLMGPGNQLPDEVVSCLAELAQQRLRRLILLREQERELEEKIAKMVHEFREADEVSTVDILLSMPGLGPCIVAVLLSEAFVELETCSKEQLRRRSIAPVTRQTGTQHPNAKNKPFVHRRYQTNKRLEWAFYHLGALAAQNSAYYGEMYAKMRARGHTHGRACRQLADRMLDVIFAMLRNRTLYDPTLHGATLN